MEKMASSEVRGVLSFICMIVDFPKFLIKFLILLRDFLNLIILIFGMIKYRFRSKIEDKMKAMLVQKRVICH